MKKTAHYTGHKWTEAELISLMKLWADDEPLAVIAGELNSSQTAILKQVQRMRKAGVPLSRRRKGHVAGRTNKSWTQAEVEYLIRRRNEKSTSEEIAIELNRTPNAVDAMIQKLRKEDVPVKMRGNGVRRLWDAETLKAVALHVIPDHAEREMIEL